MATVGDIGVAIRFLVRNDDGTVKDISAATAQTLKLLAPDGTTQTFVSSFVTDGTDGLVEYVTVLATDLHVDGKWYAQPQITTPTQTFKPEAAAFTVYRAI